MYKPIPLLLLMFIWLSCNAQPKPRHPAPTSVSPEPIWIPGPGDSFVMRGIESPDTLLTFEAQMESFRLPRKKAVKNNGLDLGMGVDTNIVFHAIPFVRPTLPPHYQTLEWSEDIDSIPSSWHPDSISHNCFPIDDNMYHTIPLIEDDTKNLSLEWNHGPALNGPTINDGIARRNPPNPRALRLYLWYRDWLELQKGPDFVIIVEDDQDAADLFYLSRNEKYNFSHKTGGAYYFTFHR